MNRSGLLRVALLYFLVIALALMIVVNRHHSRQLFAELQKLEKERDELSADLKPLEIGTKHLVKSGTRGNPF
ncbi:cell division protein FtsL [Thiothrix subterranea]|uniref:cell division protein FtsL n=1 Tax=Thiothrix subterranea TaxID=2735563 RepID=UPI0035AC19A2